MDKNEIIELTNKVYKFTLLFPKKEPLRYKIRETAQELLANLVALESLNNPRPGMILISEAMNQKKIFFTADKDLEIMNSYFEVAKWQNWVNYFDMLEIQEKYANIRGNLEIQISKFYSRDALTLAGQKELLGQKNNLAKEPVLVEIKDEGPAAILAKIDKDETSQQITRHNEILKILNKVEAMQVGEMNKFFPGVSKRTLRRDFQKLLSQHYIERIGEKNATFYRMIDKKEIKGI
jgi:hypothetical protein